MSNMQTKSARTKRYKHTAENNSEECSKDRQLSSLVSIVSNNLSVAVEVLGNKYNAEVIDELKMLCKRANAIAKELMANAGNLSKESIVEQISYLKKRMLDLIGILNEELSNLDNVKDSKTMENLVLIRRLLRESQRGLVTIQY